MKFRDNTTGDSNLRPKVSSIKPLLLGQHMQTVHIAGTSYSPFEHQFYEILRFFVTPFQVHFCRMITQFQNIGLQAYSHTVSIITKNCPKSIKSPKILLISTNSLLTEPLTAVLPAEGLIGQAAGALAGFRYSHPNNPYIFACNTIQFSIKSNKFSTLRTRLKPRWYELNRP